MRMIDADAFLERNKEFADCDFNHPKYEDTLRELVDEEPTVDAVPRQKYEEDMENAFAHGYTDAESNFRKMIADGELVEVVRCRDCKHYTWADNRAFGFPVKRCEWTGFEDADDDDFCSRGERRTDENNGRT